MYGPGMHISVDESMIGTKGRLSFLQYMPEKPTKWGIKLLVCCESTTGYIYNYQVYTGKAEHCEHGLAYRVVMDMVEGLVDEGRVVYVDNFDTSPILFRDLYNRGMYASGTVRANRKYYPSTKLDETAKQKGDMSFLHDGEMTAGKWVDKRNVYFLSTFKCDEVDEITQHQSSGSEMETVKKPGIITDYNLHMSGSCGCCTLKCHKRVFWRMVEHALTNSYILFKQIINPNHREWTQRKYRIKLAYVLTASAAANRIGQGRSSNSPLIRLKGKHFPYHQTERKRCVVCAYKKQTTNSKRRKDTKTKNYSPQCNVMENVLKNITLL